jgi:hypothetical protein
MADYEQLFRFAVADWRPLVRLAIPAMIVGGCMLIFGSIKPDPLELPRVLEVEFDYAPPIWLAEFRFTEGPRPIFGRFVLDIVGIIWGSCI